VRGGKQLLRRHRLALDPSLVALHQCAVTRQRRRGALVRGGELLFGHRIWPDAVAALDLLGPGDRLAGEAVRGRLAAEQLRLEPRGASRAAEVELGPQRRRFGRELLGRNDCLLGNLHRELGGAVVRVDETVDMTPEPET